MIKRNYFAYITQYNDNGMEIKCFFRQFSVKSFFAKDPVKISAKIMKDISNKEKCSIKRLLLQSFNRI